MLVRERRDRESFRFLLIFQPRPRPPLSLSTFFFLFSLESDLRHKQARQQQPGPPFLKRRQDLSQKEREREMKGVHSLFLLSSRYQKWKRRKKKKSTRNFHSIAARPLINKKSKTSSPSLPPSLFQASSPLRPIFTYAAAKSSKNFFLFFEYSTTIAFVSGSLTRVRSEGNAPPPFSRSWK